MTLPSWVYRKEGFCKRIWVQTDVFICFFCQGRSAIAPLHCCWLKTKNAGDAAQRSGLVDCGTQFLHMTPSRLLGPAMPARSKAVSLHSPHIKSIVKVTFLR